MRLLRSKTFYVKTEHCDGDPWDFLLNVPNGVLECGEGEVMRVSLLSWNLFVNWNNVISTNNALTIDGVPVVIPEGNYPLKQLAKTIQALYDAQRQPTNAVITVAYLLAYNKLEIVADKTIAVTFTNDSWKMLGFADSTPVSGTVIESTQPMKPRLVDNLTIGLRNVVPSTFAYTNADTGSLLPVSYLAKVPIESPPFGMNTWRSLVDGDASMFVQDTAIRSLRFRIYEDSDEALATYLPHSILSLKIDVYEKDELVPQREALEKMVEYMRLSFVQAGLGQK